MFASQLIKQAFSTSKVKHQPLQISLVNLSELREHEETEPVYLEKLKKQIQRDRTLKRPIIVDKTTKIILDGHFRFNVLKELGYSKIPTYFLDYRSSDIVVSAWRDGEKITKEDVIKAGLTRMKLPPKTSKHMFDLANHQIHVSKIVKKVDIPLEELK